MACSIYGSPYNTKSLYIYSLSALYSFHNIMRVITGSIITRTKTSIYIPYLASGSNANPHLIILYV